MQLLKQIQPSTPLWLLSFILLALILSGCASIPVPVTVHDEDLYYLKGPSGAVEMHFLTSGETDLTVAEWDSISEGMVAMSLAAFDDFNTEIGKLCSQITCDYDLLQAMNRLSSQLHSMPEIHRQKSQAGAND